MSLLQSVAMVGFGLSAPVVFTAVTYWYMNIWVTSTGWSVADIGWVLLALVDIAMYLPIFIFLVEGGIWLLVHLDIGTIATYAESSEVEQLTGVGNVIVLLTFVYPVAAASTTMLCLID